MKKIFSAFYIIFIFCLLLFVQYNNSYIKVLKINSPVSIYLDTNKNHIFDETIPFEIKNINYISSQTDLSENPILNTILPKEKIFLEYNAKTFANKVLADKYIKINDNSIIINGEKYEDLALNSGFFYDNSSKSQENLIRKIKSVNLNDYVLYNPRSKKYHSFDCPDIYKLKNFKIVNKNFIDENFIPCKNCILPEELNNNKKTSDSEIKIKDTFSKNQINIYFMDLNEVMLPSKKCTTSACKALKQEINNAKEQIDFAIYGIDCQPEIFDALINAKARGVKIRWVFDVNKYGDTFYNDTLKLKQYLTDFNCDKNYELNNSSAIMHNKFFIFDNQKVYTGSANISSTGLTGFNSNISILINNSDIAEIFKNEFEQMYKGKFHRLKTSSKPQEFNLQATKIKVMFSPQHKIITNEIIPLVQNAEHYIYIPIFFLTHKELLKELILANNRGVDVKIINDATNASNKSSITKELRSSGIKIKTENYAGKLHTKSLIIDDKYSVIGSMNFTMSGENKNDENVLIIQDAEIAEYLKETFLHIWNKIPDKYMKYSPKAESTESIGSCFDKIDNDFDGKIDKNDEGCFIKH